MTPWMISTWIRLLQWRKTWTSLEGSQSSRNKRLIKSCQVSPLQNQLNTIKALNSWNERVPFKWKVTSQTRWSKKDPIRKASKSTLSKCKQRMAKLLKYRPQTIALRMKRTRSSWSTGKRVSKLFMIWKDRMKADLLLETSINSHQPFSKKFKVTAAMLKMKRSQNSENDKDEWALSNWTFYSF